MAELTPIHEEILRILEEKESSYAFPVRSKEIGDALNVSPSYVREMTALLQGMHLVRVRRGRGGGYYLNSVIGSNTGPSNVRS
ncbi:MAG: AsnC family transcriptional regulator [Firmicutes bacterium]|jgi:DNA-binding IscR family transcriptional regulator|nr:AsnC family transcriptional regulator [Bacillota bacterium]